MPVHSDLGIRMKEYEAVPNIKLTKRTPVIIRIDGQAHHTFTRKLHKPYDTIYSESMSYTLKQLCINIQNCVFGYVQSDEISLVLIDDKNLNTSAWFDNKVEKICSIAASMATLYFNQEFSRLVEKEIFNWHHGFQPQSMTYQLKMEEYHRSLETCVIKGATFDARCFNLPKEEVTNYFYWRQIDCLRNAIQGAGQEHFSHKELEHKSCNQIVEMLQEYKQINFYNIYSLEFQRGRACYHTPIDGWVVDYQIPIFKGEDRDYIEKYLYINVEPN